MPGFTGNGAWAHLAACVSRDDISPGPNGIWNMDATEDEAGRERGKGTNSAGRLAMPPFTLWTVTYDCISSRRRRPFTDDYAVCCGAEAATGPCAYGKRN